MRDLLLIGAGGIARETADAVGAINAVHPTWNLLGYLDDDLAKQGTIVSGLPVLGPIDAVGEHPDAAVVLCTVRPDNYVSRKAIAGRLELDEARYATIVHPSATIGASSIVGAGSVLLAHVDVTVDVVIGCHVMVMPQVVLPHDVRVDDYVTIASGVRVGGGTHLAECAYIGASATIRQDLSVGERALVGMAAVVTRDVPSERMWFGTPARDMGPAPLSALR